MSQEDQPPDGRTVRDLWDKLDIVLKGLPSVAVALLGILGSMYLQRHQDTEAKVQLYAELMTNRERSDTDLRKEMFNSVISTFLEPKRGQIRDQVLALEMLTYNFHDVIDFGPLFQHVERAIAIQPDQEREALQWRLRRAAADVIDRQLAALGEVGAIRMETMLFDNLQDKPEGITVLDADVCLPLAAGICGRKRKFFIHVLKADGTAKLLKLLLEVSLPDKPSEVETSNTFWVGLSDFPLIDNTRLKEGDRVAVVLRRWAEGSAELALAYFPGSRASLKDKVYYDEVVKELVGTSND